MAHQYNTRNPRLCALRVADPDAFVKEVTVAIEKHEGNIAKASSELDVERRTLFMWLEDYPQLKKATAAARKVRYEALREKSDRIIDERIAADKDKKSRKRKRKAA
jgi:formyltetrahydrofolate hydrolase